MMTRTPKQAKTYRLSPVAVAILESVSQEEGKSYTAILEEAIRELGAKKEKKKTKNTH